MDWEKINNNVNKVMKQDGSYPCKRNRLSNNDMDETSENVSIS